LKQSFTDQELADALQTCADEPVHIPGIIQPCGCLVAVSFDTHIVNYASESCDGYLGQAAHALLGQNASTAVSRSDIASQTVSAGTHRIGDQQCVVRAHKSGDQLVIEIEPFADIGMEGPEAVQTLSYLMTRVQSCETEERLFELSAELLLHLTGYERVTVYRFDPEWNGEIVAEAKHAPLDSLMGLRFPHWDIPKQARDIMARLPMRFIQDIDQAPVPILASSEMPPLDISLAHVRGVSTVHMEYLRNMGIAATMTLSIKVNGSLWGIISFHHRRPKVPAPALRDILVSFLLVFSGKLETLQQRAAVSRIEALDKGFVSQTNDNFELSDVMPAASSVIMEVMQAHGIAAINKGEVVGEGNLPDPDVMMHLADLALSTGEVVAIETLSTQFPEYADQLNGVAGALIVGVLPTRAICIFRNEIEREVAWAGSPEKTIEVFDDRLRLSPRGSFSTFLSQVKGYSDAWSENDKFLVGHLRTLLNAAEREAVMETLNRKQEMMIGELNHRVRNILALVRSVSRQARRRYASLDSYANAIENRIRALAAAHNINGKQASLSVSMHALLKLEFDPFQTRDGEQTTIVGPDRYLNPAIAPIFSLVIHELTTNSAKYGALLKPQGRITVELSMDNANFHIRWRETGGPKVIQPKVPGFGMALIEQAVPHELNGTAKVDFTPEGLNAEFSLPLRHFSNETVQDTVPMGTSLRPEVATTLPAPLRAGTILVLEDNYIVAKEMSDQLHDMGATDVRTCPSVSAALEVVENERLTLAVLDVNLGPKERSDPVAIRLLQLGVPIIFVTGYGEDANLPAALNNAPVLTKPISSEEFMIAANRL